MRRKNAPIKTRGIKYATVNGDSAFYVIVMIEVHPSKVTDVKMATKA